MELNGLQSASQPPQGNSGGPVRVGERVIICTYQDVPISGRIRLTGLTEQQATQSAETDTPPGAEDTGIRWHSAIRQESDGSWSVIDWDNDALRAIDPQARTNMDFAYRGQTDAFIAEASRAWKYQVEVLQARGKAAPNVKIID